MMQDKVTNRLAKATDQKIRPRSSRRRVTIIATGAIAKQCLLSCIFSALDFLESRFSRRFTFWSPVLADGAFELDY
jgi:hypothetical protein